MTRKQALLQAIEIISNSKEVYRKTELMLKLSELVEELPIVSWSEDTIHDSIQQWAMEHGSNPTTTDLRSKVLPPHPVIQNRYKMTASEFLKQYYPQDDVIYKTEDYTYKTKDEWLEFFKLEYMSMQDEGANHYNQRRKKGTPTWATLANMFDLKSWNELLRYCGLTRKPKIRLLKERVRSKIKIKSYNNIEMSISELYDEEYIPYQNY